MTDHEIKAIMERAAQMHADIVRMGEALLRERDETFPDVRLSDLIAEVLKRSDVDLNRNPMFQMYKTKGHDLGDE